MSPRYAFEKSLAELQQDILRMASLVEQAIYEAVESLMKQDVTGAAQVIMGDEMIDNLYLEIEDKCVKLIATQQPMARDLRVAITGIKICLSLERMADHAVDIARATMCLSGQPFTVKCLEYIPQMGRLARQMVKEGLDAYVNSDVQKAREMCALDDEVDYLFARMFRELVGNMEEDPRTVVQAAYLLYVSRYLERIADHATNIGEAVIYLVTGERRELN
ncbi:phosphate signaling complex protein PhoU [Desulfovirgula thermocuniculi]|uniref:phosphate signaling complex protein PhoU n=1 Tax=Desulfovirgula thermocuniculi TaxID=348842 RepID=UPI00042083E8|nr:phosphate signaling complex protein PhoU [Desulfovirgula thermocuniculi]